MELGQEVRRNGPRHLLSLKEFPFPALALTDMPEDILFQAGVGQGPGSYTYALRSSWGSKVAME